MRTQKEKKIEMKKIFDDASFFSFFLSFFLSFFRVHTNKRGDAIARRTDAPPPARNNARTMPPPTTSSSSSSSSPCVSVHVVVVAFFDR